MRHTDVGSSAGFSLQVSSFHFGFLVPADTFLVVDPLVLIRYPVSGWHVVLINKETFWFERGTTPWSVSISLLTLSLQSLCSWRSLGAVK